MSGAAVLPQSRIGQLLQGEYLIKGILGQGELGVTYEAENARLKSKFAVLMLSRELKPTFEMLLAMRNDLRHAEQLTQSGLMPAKQVVDAQQIPGIATELLEGETLRARLQRGPMQAGRAVALCLAIARALDAAHKAGMVHGDLRPENIFLVKPGAKSRYAGKAVVVEHSLHHLRRRPPGFDDSLPIYKLVYRPPEQIMGELGVSTQGDVFVLGAILYECLTGRPAFFAEEREFVYEKLASPPPALRVNAAIGLTETLAQALSVIIGNACQRDPGERIADMSEVIEQLEHVVKATGLVLPDVVTEVPQAAPQVVAGAAPGRMNRVLQRLSGIFPQISLPPSPPSDPNIPAPKPGAGQGAAGTSRPGVDPHKPVAVPARAEVPATLQPITAPKKRVSQVLQRLSGTFMAIQPPPGDEDAPPRSTEPAKAPASSPPVSSPPVSGPPASAVPAAGAPATSSGPSVVQTAAQTPGSDAMRALALIQQLARPGGTGPVAPIQGPPNPLPPKSSTEGLEELMRPTLPPSESELLALRMAPVAGAPAVKSGPVVTPAAERSGPAAPVSPAAERSGPAAPVVVPAVASTSGPAAVPAAAVAAPAALPVDLDDLPTAIKGTAAAASGPVNAPVPVSDSAAAAKSGRAPAPDLAAVPTAIKAAPSEPEPAAPASPSRSGSELAAVPTEVKAAPKEPAVSEPVPASRRDAPSDFAAAPTAIKTVPAEPDAAAEPAALPPEFLAAPTSVRSAPVAPAREISLSSAETPPRGTALPAPVASNLAMLQAATQPRRPRFALDTTLPPDDDAVELIEPEKQKPAEPVPPAPPAVSAAPEPRAETAATGSDAPPATDAGPGTPATRPASEVEADLAELKPLEANPITEQATRPALRRLPITEAATQAKLDVSSLVAALAAQSDPVGPAATPPPSAPPVSSALPEPAETPPAGSVAPPQLATPAPTGAKPPASPPQRAKRVSQLLEVLKQAPPPPPPSSPGGVAEAQSPLGTGGIARLPARLSPGLVPHAPTALPGQAAPWETSSQQVVAPPPSVPAPPPSFRTFLLQHQEAVAALIGALLVLLISLAFVFWR